MSSQEKTPCLVVYDVVEDRCRQRISEACLDYGLERFQMSAFWGHLTATRRREMFLKLKDLLGESVGRILVQPVSQDDVEKRLLLNQRPEEDGGKPAREWPEPGAPKSTILKF